MAHLSHPTNTYTLRFFPRALPFFFPSRPSLFTKFLSFFKQLIKFWESGVGMRLFFSDTSQSSHFFISLLTSHFAAPNLTSQHRKNAPLFLPFTTQKISTFAAKINRANRPLLLFNPASPIMSYFGNKTLTHYARTSI